jgi:uncharacterized protein with von Willebrand factor type A (vWA) domain
VLADRIARNFLILPRMLRRDLPIDASRARAFLAAASELDPAREEDIRAAARATLVAHPTDIPRFETTFDAWVGVLSGRVAAANHVDSSLRAETSGGRLDAPLQGAGGPKPARKSGEAFSMPAASRMEVLRAIDFGAMTVAERAAATRFLDNLEWSPGLRPSRRFRPSARGARYDARATLRRSLRAAGEPLFLRRLATRPKPRSLVVICDVSGSMEPYTRLLLHMTFALTRAWTRFEAFTFGTRLTRITPRLRHRRADQALDRVARDVHDWSGGTRIGESLRTFNRHWSRRVLGRGAVVLLCTDGWEQGDATELAAEAERLQRASYRLLWLDPLAGTRGYAAESAGARILARVVDDHLPANTLDGLVGVAAAFAGAGKARPARRQTAS